MGYTTNAPLPLNRDDKFTLNALADAYMACYLGRTPDQGSRIRFFLEHLGSKTACEIDADDVEDALQGLRERGRLFNRGGTKHGGDIIAINKPLANGTINRYRSALQVLLTWARKKRLMPKGWSNPVNDTQRLPENNTRTRYLKEDEYGRLLRVSRVSYWSKLTLLIMLAVTTGARKGTLMGLKWSDIDLDTGRAYCARTKNGEPFILVLVPDVIAEFKRFIKKSQPDDLVFCGRRTDKPMNFEKAWKNALHNAAIDGACFHTLRHTHASWLAKRGAPLLAIADSLGHKSLAMTKRYSHLCVDTRAEMLNRIFGTELT